MRTQGRTPLVIAVATLLAVVAAGCGEDAPEQVTLRVTAVAWNGWDRDFEPVPQEREVTVTEGDSFEVGGVGYTVEEVSDDEVELRSSREMALREGDEGIDVSGDGGETGFTLPRDGEIRMSTPTLDAGTTVTIAEV